MSQGRLAGLSIMFCRRIRGGGGPAYNQAAGITGFNMELA